MAGAENEQKKGSPVDMVLNIWKQWPMSLKAGVIIAIVVVIAVAILYNNHSAQFKMVPLYTKEISGEDIEEIKLELVKQGYQEGTHFDVIKGEKTSSISVQSVLRSQILSQMANVGLPRAFRTTFENKGGGGFTQTEDERNLSNLLALQGELENSIMMMEGIIDARVKLVPKKEALFESEQEPGKATIMIKPQSGYSVSKAQIQGIINLVAGSVAGINLEDIKVVDTRGVTLSDLVASDTDEYGMPSSGAQQERQKEFEQTLTRSAQDLLDKSLGDGNAIVEVRANLNFDQKEQQMEVLGSPTGGDSGSPMSFSQSDTSYDSGGGEQGYITIGGRTVGVNQAAGFQPVSTGDQLAPSTSGGHVVSYQIDREAYTNDGESADGVTPAGGEAGKASDYDHTVTQVNIEHDKYQTHIITAPGGVDRLSVALMLNNVPEDRVESIKNAVAASVGLDPGRGDVISVTNFAFQRSEYEDMRNEMLTSAPVSQANSGTAISLPAINKTYIGIGGAVIVMLFLIVFALFLAKQKKSDKEKMQLHLTTGPTSSINPIADLLSDKSGRTVAPSVGTNTSIDELTRLAKEKPTKVAELLKTSWMADK